MSSTESSPYHLPAHFHPLIHEGGIVYLNSQSGTWGVMGRRVGAALLDSCGALSDLDLEWRELRQADPYKPEIVEGLCAQGFLAVGTDPGRLWPQVSPPENIEFSEAGIIATARPLAEPRPPETRLERLAEQNLEKALTLLHKRPFPALSEEIQNLRQATGAAPADPDQALEIARAVYQVSDWHIGKFACLEHSTATVLAAAQEGLHIDLQFGASIDPIEYHAWPSVQGEVVALPHDAPVAGRFHPVFEI